jgi:hypothetical protein
VWLDWRFSVHRRWVAVDDELQWRVEVNYEGRVSQFAHLDLRAVWPSPETGFVQTRATWRLTDCYQAAVAGELLDFLARTHSARPTRRRTAFAKRMNARSSRVGAHLTGASGASR